MRPLRERVAAVQRSLTSLYRLDLDFDAARFVVEPARARELLPPGSPRTGLVVLEEADAAQVGLYVDPADLDDPRAVFEETSHLVYLAWQCARGHRVSLLELEIQAEVDRYAFVRLAGGDALAHFRGVRFHEGLGSQARRRYRQAHRAALRTCRDLERRFPRRGDTPGLLAVLRRYYRLGPQAKLHAAA